jgi:hypothetical protein
MKFARLVFWIAALWGVLILVPLYFALDAIGRRDPPPLTHVEFYYGFLGVTLAWQLAFFVIGSDPLRFRPMMLPAIAEKFFQVITMTLLYLQARIKAQQLAVNTPDLVLGVLFVIAFVRTGGHSTGWSKRDSGVGAAE